MATNTAVTIPAHDSSTDAQSAPASASNVHVFHNTTESNDPSSHPPSRTSSIEEPVTTIPITNTTSPIPITAGITRGRLIDADRDQKDHTEREGREPALQCGGLQQFAQRREER